MPNEDLLWSLKAATIKQKWGSFPYLLKKSVLYEETASLWENRSSFYIRTFSFFNSEKFLFMLKNIIIAA
jgi:hypothetical protein